MRKTQILSLLTLLSLISFAQKSESFIGKAVKFNKPTEIKQQNHSAIKSANDTAWYDDFSETTKWTTEALKGPMNWVIEDKDGPSDSALVSNIGMNNNFVGNIAMFTAIDFLVDDELEIPDTIEATITLNEAIHLNTYSHIVISWDQQYVVWNAGELFLEYSFDATSWTTFGGEALFSDYNVTEFVPSPQINISNELGEQPMVYLRFRYFATEGTGYGIMMDNIRILEVGENDMMIEDPIINMVRPFDGFYHQIPLVVAEKTKIGFGASVYNLGYADQSGVKLDVTVSNSNNDILYNKFGPEKNISSATRDTILLGVNTDTEVATWTDSSLTGIRGIGDYSINLEVSTDNQDEDINNNKIQKKFNVGWDRFARNNSIQTSATSPSIWAGGDADGSAIGVVYSMPAKGSAKGISVYISPNSSTGGLLAVLSTWNGSEWTPVLYSDESKEITETNAGSWTDIYFPEDGATEIIGPDAGEEPIPYLISLEFYNADYQGIQIGEDAITKSPRWATQWNFGDGYKTMSNYTKTPMINFIVKPSITDINIIEKSEVEIYPNPSVGTINFKNAKNADIEIYNVLGNKVMSFSNVSKSVNISELTNGTYIVKINNNNTLSTNRITLIK